MSEEEAKKFIEKYLSKYKPLFKRARAVWWKAYTKGDKEYFEEYENLSNKISEIHNSKKDFEKIKKLLDSKISEGLIRRQLEVLYNRYLTSQGDLDLIKEITSKETDIQRKFNAFRSELDGKKITENEIKNILRKSTNSDEVEKAWKASKKQGEIVEKELLEVVKLRNKLAKSLGFENYYEMFMKADEQDPDMIKKVFEELDWKTKDAFEEIKKEIDGFLSKKFNISIDDLKPWHYQDLFFQEGIEIYDLDLDKFYDQDPLEISKNFYKSIGMDVEDILERSDLYEKEGKSQHALCMDLDREGDVRILENIKDNEYWTETTLHELGHAVYYKYMDIDLPFLLKDCAHICTTESIAMLFGRQTKNSSFIKKYSENSEKLDSGTEEKLTKTLQFSQLIACRWYQVMVNFERELYKNSEQDLNAFWWRLVKKFQMIDFSRDKPDWASKIHFTIAPVYYHNYMLGEMLASQLHSIISREIIGTESLSNVDYSGNEKISSFLRKNIFEQGLKFKWDVLNKKATDEEVTPKYFVEEFAS